MAAALLCLAWQGHAQIPPRARAPRRDYFPLAVGNQWVYRQQASPQAPRITVEVTGATERGGHTYYELSGYAGARAWVRQTGPGELVEQVPRDGSEQLWYSFYAPDRAAWNPQLFLPCLGQARISARNAEVRVPAGAFSSALLIHYLPGLCSDAGFLEEAFAPGVGLLRRTEITFAGPRTMELVSARINGMTLEGSDLFFDIALDQPVYFANFMPPVDPLRAIPLLTARLTIHNVTAAPVTLQFSSGQQFDLAIREAGGGQALQWSAGKFFIQSLTRVELGPGEARSFPVELRLAGRSGKTLPEGRYTAEGWLTTVGDKRYAATAAFEIRYTF